MTSIATLGSHCSLQVLKGAKDEGLKTILVCEKKREKLYRRFPFIDELIIVDKFREVLDEKVQATLEQNDAVLIPHGTLIAQMSSDEIESIKTPIFGNKWILRWESDREMKEKLMREATLPMPKPVTNPSEIEKLSIVKRQGAAGGKGYFMAANEDDYNTKRNQLISFVAQLEFFLTLLCRIHVFDQLRRIPILLLMENRKMSSMLKPLQHILECTVFHLQK